MHSWAVLYADRQTPYSFRIGQLSNRGFASLGKYCSVVEVIRIASEPWIGASTEKLGLKLAIHLISIHPSEWHLLRYYFDCQYYSWSSATVWFTFVFLHFKPLVGYFRMGNETVRPHRKCSLLHGRVLLGGPAETTICHAQWSFLFCWLNFQQRS